MKLRTLLTSSLATPSQPDVKRTGFTFPLGHISFDHDGDLANWVIQFFHNNPQTSALERTLQLQHGVDKTRSTTVIDSKPKLHWRTARRQGLYSTVGEVFKLHWIATTRLKSEQISDR